MNYEGSVPSMETEGIKRIFGRSEETHKLQYTEYFGDGNSKAYNEVENCYEGVHVEKKECVGHVQKTVENALRNIKKRKHKKRKQSNWKERKTNRCFN